MLHDDELCFQTKQIISSYTDRCHPLRLPISLEDKSAGISFDSLRGKYFRVLDQLDQEIQAVLDRHDQCRVDEDKRAGTVENRGMKHQRRGKHNRFLRFNVRIGN